MATERCQRIIDYLGSRRLGGILYRCDTSLTTPGDAGAPDAR
jgi:hypothetical protein